MSIEEPVAYWNPDESSLMFKEGRSGAWIPLYAAPPKHEWVGLTNEEIDDLWKTAYFNIHYELPRVIEAKLKDKNNA